MAGGRGLRRRHGPVQAAGLAVQPAALLGRALPDRLRRRRPAAGRARVRAAGRAAGDRGLQPRHLRPTRTPSPSRPWAGCPDWSRSRWTWATGPRTYRRELNTMPNWAGSCWYELRYLDPTNEDTFVDPASSGTGWAPQSTDDCGGVDLYVGGVEHAVLHLLYARFWHKVLYDLGHVSSSEPFRRLFNQGIHPGLRLPRRLAASTSRPPTWSRPRTAGYVPGRRPVDREYGKMGKSLKNVVAPDEMSERYGADTLRLYEMFTGPLDQSRPWDTDRRGRHVPPAAADLAGGGRRGDRRSRGRSTTRSGDDDRARAAPHDRRRSATAWRRCASTPRSPGSPS